MLMNGLCLNKLWNGLEQSQSTSLWWGWVLTNILAASFVPNSSYFRISSPYKEQGLVLSLIKSSMQSAIFTWVLFVFWSGINLFAAFHEINVLILRIWGRLSHSEFSKHVKQLKKPRNKTNFDTKCLLGDSKKQLWWLYIATHHLGCQ